MSIVKPEELKEYFDTSKRYFGRSYSKTKQINDRGIVTEDGVDFSVNEYKLIRYLLKNPEFYTSGENSIMYAEGENGYAYVLGYKKGSQLLF